jgi:hypothetical protein
MKIENMCGRSNKSNIYKKEGFVIVKVESK